MFKLIVIAFSLILSTSLITGQQKEGKPIILIHADSLVGKVIDTETIREVSGRVEFRHDNVTVRCDRAVHYPGPNRAELYGNVTVIRDTVTLKAPRGIYYGDKREALGFDGVQMSTKRLLITAHEGRYLVDEKVAYFYREVVVIDSTTTITAPELTYYETEHKSVAAGNVKVVNTRDKATMYGGLLEHFDNENYSRMLLNPKFVQIDTSSVGKVDTLIIVAKEMESFSDTVRRFIVRDTVQLVRGELSGKSGEGVYFSEKDLVILRKEPIVWYEDSQVTGDSIRIQLQRRRLDKVFVYGNGFAATISDSVYQHRFNQLTGQSMTLSFANDRLEWIEADGTAISLYFLYEDGLPNGLNKASGDRISVNSKDGRAEYIRVVGGTEGQYYPENLVAGSESIYNLPGFSWKTDRPRMGKELNIVGLSADKTKGFRVGK